MNQKALIYCRVSSAKQVQEGHGLESQEHRCREFARHNSLSVESVFQDGDISGSLFERPAMRQLLKYLDQHKGESYIVIFDDLKRFSRDVETHYRLKKELVKRRKAELKCLNFNFEDSPIGTFIETVMAGYAQLEREQNTEQVCNKMTARIEKGYWCFCPPTGYKYQNSIEHGKILTPVRPIANIVAEGLTAYANNILLGQVDLQRFLESKKLYRLLGAKKIHLEFVKRILTEPLYAGWVEYPKWKISRRRGHHRAIIAKATFEKNQLKLKRPERKIRLTDRLEFPLRRIISCGVCSRKMTGSTSRGQYKSYPHYTCNNKECTATPKNITAGLLEEEYVRLLSRISSKTDATELAKQIARRICNDKDQDVLIGNETSSFEIESLGKQIDGYIDQIPRTSNPGIRARYEAKIEELEVKIRELETVPKEQNETDYERTRRIVLKFLTNPAEAWKDTDNEIRLLIHNLIFTENPRYSTQSGFATPKLAEPFYLEDDESKIEQ